MYLLNFVGSLSRTCSDGTGSYDKFQLIVVKNIFFFTHMYIINMMISIAKRSSKKCSFRPLYPFNPSFQRVVNQSIQFSGRVIIMLSCLFCQNKFIRALEIFSSWSQALLISSDFCQCVTNLKLIYLLILRSKGYSAGVELATIIS